MIVDRYQEVVAEADVAHKKTLHFEPFDLSLWKLYEIWSRIEPESPETE
jgi:hypothetical protein